jgi:hypothetical protein
MYLITGTNRRPVPGWGLGSIAQEREHGEDAAMVFGCLGQAEP